MYKDNDENEFEDLDFLDDDSDLRFIDIEDDTDDFRVDLDDKIFEEEITYLDDEEDEEEDSYNHKYEPDKKKMSGNQVVNRVMIGMGAVIVGFTVFYGTVVYGFLHKNKKNSPNGDSQDTPVVVQEDGKFTSPYSDKNISEDVKNILNGETLKPTVTNFTELDDRVKTILGNTVEADKSNYENLRNIYDYLMYNFKIQKTSYLDEDAVYNMVNNVNYVATLDTKIIYRANKALKNNQGSSDDFACAFVVMARQFGYDAYYIDGAIINESGMSESHGFAIIDIDETKYIFDPEYDSNLLNAGSTTEDSKSTETTVLTYEDNDSTEAAEAETNAAEQQTDSNGAQTKILTNTVPEYYAFCKTFKEVEEVYTTADVEKSIENFGKFETLGEFKFDVSITSSGGNAYGSVSYKAGYSEDGNTTAADGDITVDIGTTIRLKGIVSGSNENTWKLVIKQFDSDMDEIREVTLYNDTDTLTENTLSFTPSRAGYSRIIYMVTDANGRTCTVTKTVRVLGDEPEEVTTTYEPETTTRRYEPETTTEPEEQTTEEETTKEPETETTTEKEKETEEETTAPEEPTTEAESEP